ncbi:MAG TPA: hypothetical protein VM686_19195 [Polyangiaceae bacterium]|nr:hypothetical protein [Polyangiaceae bacterium]
MLTTVAAIMAVASSIATRRSFECAGSLQIVPEPAAWRGWPSEQGKLSGGPELPAFEDRLFGFLFRYGKPLGTKYPGYGFTELVDPALCPHSEVSLDSWFSQGSAPWTRHPEELALHRSPGDGTMVISGKSWERFTGGAPPAPEFVVAFRRRLEPTTFTVAREPALPLLPLWLAAISGAVGLAGSAAGKLEPKKTRLWCSLLVLALMMFALVKAALDSIAERMV